MWWIVLRFLVFHFLDLVFKSLEIHTVHGRKIFHTWEECEKLIQSGAVKPGPVINYSSTDIARPLSGPSADPGTFIEWRFMNL